jgi:hypothetical protein
MPIKFKNGRLAKENDPVVGIDWRGAVVKGTAVAGDKAKGHDELVFRHEVFKTICPSLHLVNFLHADDAVISTDGIHSVTAKEADKPASPSPTEPAPAPVPEKTEPAPATAGA